MLLNNKNSFSVAFGGVCGALSVVLLLVASLLPAGRLAFVFAASVIVGLLIVTKGIRTAVVQYLAVSVLALLFVPHKPVAVLYAVVVGNYPLLKRYIETIPILLPKLAIKLVLFKSRYFFKVCLVSFLLEQSSTIHISKFL